MLTRELAQQIQSDWASATDMSASSIRQFEDMIDAAIALTRVQIAMANAGKVHWDYASGLATDVAAADDTATVGDGQYAAGYIEKIRAMWASYTVWLATPISTTVGGQAVTLDERPLDLIMSKPTAGIPGE